MSFSDSERNFPCGSCLFHGKVSPNITSELGGSRAEPLSQFPSELGFKFSIPQTPRLMLPVVSIIPL